MKKMLFAFSMAGILLLSACGRPAAEETEAAETTAEAERAQETSGVLVIEDAGEDKNKTISVRIVDSSNPALPGREAKKVRGIYITGPVAGNEEVLNGVLDGALAAGINAVVIDFKEDQGRITCPVSAATVNEIGASIPYVRDMKSLIESLKERGYYSVGLDGGGDALVGETGFETDPLVVVLGSEGNGLSRLVREACDSIAGIPMSNMVESLNASVAAGITLYAVARARREAAAAK